jgi:hypothetical protein
LRVGCKLFERFHCWFDSQIDFVVYPYNIVVCLERKKSERENEGICVRKSEGREWESGERKMESTSFLPVLAPNARELLEVIMG